jgi:hypothetical protein
MLATVPTKLGKAPIWRGTIRHLAGDRSHLAAERPQVDPQGAHLDARSAHLESGAPIRLPAIAIWIGMEPIWKGVVFQPAERKRRVGSVRAASR